MKYIPLRVFSSTKEEETHNEDTEENQDEEINNKEEKQMLHEDDDWDNEEESSDDDDENEYRGLISSNAPSASKKKRSFTNQLFDTITLPHYRIQRLERTKRFLTYAGLVLACLVIGYIYNHGHEHYHYLKRSYNNRNGIKNNKQQALNTNGMNFDSTASNPNPFANYNTNQKIKIVILGERNSGLHQLAHYISECYPNHYVSTTFARMGYWFQSEELAMLETDGNTKYIVIAVFLNVYDWIDLMRLNPLHAPAHEHMDWLSFVTSPWTMMRPESDQRFHPDSMTSNALHPNEKHHYTYCQENFEYEQVVPCLNLHHDNEYPLYEMRQDGKSGFFNNILELRAQKIRNFISTMYYEDVIGFLPIKFEDLIISQSLESILTELEISAGLFGTCNSQMQFSFTVDDSSLLSESTSDSSYYSWLLDNVDWSAEKLIGYESGEGISTSFVKDGVEYKPPSANTLEYSHGSDVNGALLHNDDASWNFIDDYVKNEAKDFEAASSGGGYTGVTTTASKSSQSNSVEDPTLDDDELIAKIMNDLTEKNSIDDDLVVTKLKQKGYKVEDLNHDAARDKIILDDTDDVFHDDDDLFLDDDITIYSPIDAKNSLNTPSSPMNGISASGGELPPNESYTHSGSDQVGNFDPRIVILAERNSGLDWLLKRITNCFPHIDVSTTLVREHFLFQTPSQHLERPTIILSLFADPYTWVELMRRQPQHAPNHKNMNWQDFVSTPWITSISSEQWKSIKEGVPSKTPCQHNFNSLEVVPCTAQSSFYGAEDRAIYELNLDGSGGAYASILELRADKILNFISTSLWGNVLTFVTINYESLMQKGEFERILMNIRDETGLVSWCDDTSIDDDFVAPSLSSDTAYDHNFEFVEYLDDHLNWDVERMIGYNLDVI